MLLGLHGRVLLLLGLHGRVLLLLGLHGRVLRLLGIVLRLLGVVLRLLGRLRVRGRFLRRLLELLRLIHNLGVAQGSVAAASSAPRSRVGAAPGVGSRHAEDQQGQQDANHNAGHCAPIQRCACCCRARGRGRHEKEARGDGQLVAA